MYGIVHLKLQLASLTLSVQHTLSLKRKKKKINDNHEMRTLRSMDTSIIGTNSCGAKVREPGVADTQELSIANEWSTHCDIV